MDTSYGSDSDEEKHLLLKSNIPPIVFDIRETYEKKVAVFLMLMSILCERIAFYSLVHNLSHTLQSNSTVQWESNHISTASLIFTVTRCLSALFFAAVCDAKLGRPKTIFIGFIFYVIGYVSLTVNTNPTTTFCNSSHPRYHIEPSIYDEQCVAWVFSALICTAIAAGIVQTNVAVYSAEQINTLSSISRFADKYIVAVNIGEILAVLIVPYTHLHGEKEMFFYIYLISLILLLASIILFLIASRYCYHSIPYDSVVTKCVPVVINAFQSWRTYKRNKALDKIRYSAVDPTFGRATSYSYNGVQNLPVRDDGLDTFLDFAKVINNGKFQDRIVDDVNALRRGAIVFTLLIAYWLAYSQISTTFPQQSYRMINPWEDIPIEWITLADPIIIIIGIVLLHFFVNKHLKKWNKETIISIKFIIGFCFAACAMLLAGIVEIFRQRSCISIDERSTLSIYYTIPQNIFVGLSELFAMVASYEFAYFAAPRSGASLFMSLHFAAAGSATLIGFAFNSLFVQSTDNDSYWKCSEHVEAWRSYTYFFILAAIQIIFMFIFILCYKKTQLFRLNPQQLEINERLSQQSLPSDVRI